MKRWICLSVVAVLLLTSLGCQPQASDPLDNEGVTTVVTTTTASQTTATTATTTVTTTTTTAPRKTTVKTTTATTTTTTKATTTTGTIVAEQPLPTIYGTWTGFYPTGVESFAKWVVLESYFSNEGLSEYEFGMQEWFSVDIGTECHHTLTFHEDGTVEVCVRYTKTADEVKAELRGELVRVIDLIFASLEKRSNGKFTKAGLLAEEGYPDMDAFIDEVWKTELLDLIVFSYNQIIFDDVMRFEEKEKTIVFTYEAPDGEQTTFTARGKPGTVLMKLEWGYGLQVERILLEREI